MPNKEPARGWRRQPPEGRPQQPGQGWAAPPEAPPPRRRSSAGRIVGCSCLGLILLVVALVVGGLLAGGGDDDPRRKDPSPTTSAERSREEEGPRGDVKITACEVNATTHWPHAELLVTNRSSKDSDYRVHVEFTDTAGKRLSESYASTNRVAPGQQSAVTAQSLDEVRTKITCHVKAVNRFAS